MNRIGQMISGFLLLILFESGVYSNELHFNTINMSSGLSHNSALCLLQDHTGFVWIGTRDGLNKFDGVNYEIYKHVFFDTTSLVNNQVNCIAETKSQEIWIGTADGLCKYDSKTNRFTAFSLTANSRQFDSYYIRTICETTDNELWIGSTNGLYVIDNERKNSKFILLHPDSLNLANNVRKIYQDSKGNIWLGTSDGLYVKRKDNIEKCIPEWDASKLMVRDIVENKDGLLWLGTENDGVYVLKTDNDSIEVKIRLNTANSKLSSNIVRKIFFENENDVWIGSFSGLSIYNQQTQECNTLNFLKTETVVSNNSVHDIMRDSTGGIWLAIYLGGVSYYHTKKNIFEHRLWGFPDNKEFNSSVISVLLEDDRKNLWIGTEGGGVYLSKDEGETIYQSIKIPDSRISQNTIKSMAFGNNKLWFGTLTGLNSYDLATKRITSYVNSPNLANSINAGHVLALLYENEEKIWIGTNGGGVQIFNPANGSFENVEALKNKHVRCLFRDSKERVWIGCEQNIFLINDSGNNLVDLSGTIENWNNSNLNVTFITQDSQKNMWIGTQGFGLYLIKDDKLLWYNTSNGIIDNTVNSLLEGDENQLWITTNKGLSKITISDDHSGQPKIYSSTYSVGQGLQGLQYSPNCALKSKSGKLFFGGINGLNFFRHSDVVEYDFYPNLVFNELQINYQLIRPGEKGSPLAQSLNETNELTLDFNQRDFSISFSGINFINPDKNIYRYMVSGIDKLWVEMGSQRVINFTYFPVGTYEIKVQVSTNPNKWESAYRSLTVTILPPWWKTWWAFLLYGLLLIGLLFFFFSLSQKWARMKNQLAMQHFQNEKENELHQLKLKFYTDVSHELRTPLTLILAPLENLISKTELSNRFRNQLLQIQRSGFRLMQLVNQILDLRKLETGNAQLRVAQGNIIRFFTEISLAFKEVATSKNINFDFIPHKNELLLWYDRDKLEIIINNLLSNAFKFTPSGGKVQLELKEINGSDLKEQFSTVNKEKTYLQVCITDNGEGINHEDLQTIYTRFYTKHTKPGLIAPGAGVGLELTKRMVELHKGTIGVESYSVNENERKTVFSFYLPFDVTAYSPDEIDREFKNSEDQVCIPPNFCSAKPLCNKLMKRQKKYSLPAVSLKGY